MEKDSLSPSVTSPSWQMPQMPVQECGVTGHKDYKEGKPQPNLQIGKVRLRGTLFPNTHLVCLLERADGLPTLTRRQGQNSG